MKIFPLLLASIALAGVESARSPLQISGTTISHATTDGNCHVPKSFGKPSGYQLTTNGGSCDLFWSAPGGAFVDSARVAGLADSAKAAHTLQQTYNASTSPQITTSVTKGALTLRRGSASDPDAVLSVQDGSGVQTAYIAGNGAVAGAQVSVSSATANTLARFDAAKYLTSYALVAGDIPALPYLPLAAGAGSPLTGVLYGQGLNFTTTANAPITIAQNLAGGFTHPFQAFNSGMVAGNQYNFDFGQSASTNNAANFGFKYVGAGSSSNYVTLGMYGANDLLTITAAGVPKFSGLATAGFVRANASGQLSSSALIAADIPALSYHPLENQRLSTGYAPAFSSLALSNTLTTLDMTSTAAAVNGRMWRWRTSSGGRLSLIAANDAGSSGGTAIEFARSGTTATGATVYGGLTLNGMGAGTVKSSAAGTLSSSAPTYAELTGTVPTWNQSTTGNAATATKWATARTLTIGATGKTIDGTGNQSWSLAEIGAQAAGSYLPLAAGASFPLSGILHFGDAAGSYIKGGRNSAGDPYFYITSTNATTSGIRLMTSNSGTPVVGLTIEANGAISFGSLVAKPYPSDATYFSIWGDLANPPNYTLTGKRDGAETYLSAGTKVSLAIAGTEKLQVTSTGVALPTLTGATTRVATINAAGQIGAGEVASTTPQAFGSNINLSSVTSRTLYPTASGLSITIPTSGVTLGQTFKLSTNAYSVTILCPGVTVYYAGTTYTSGSSIAPSVMVDIVCLSATVWAIGIN